MFSCYISICVNIARNSCVLFYFKVQSASLCSYTSDISFTNSRPSPFLQPIILRIRHRVDGRWVADSHGQHQHVHLRNSTSFHSDGARRHDAHERDNRKQLEEWRLDTGPRYVARLFHAATLENFRSFPGGSISNLYAFLAARHKMFPNYKEKGIATILGQLVMYTSDQVSVFW